MDKWDAVIEALSRLNEIYYKFGADSRETHDALTKLMTAYDEWLD